MYIEQEKEDGYISTSLKQECSNENVYYVTDSYENDGTVKIFGLDDSDTIIVDKDDIPEFITMLATHSNLKKTVDKNQLLLDVYANSNFQKNFAIKFNTEIKRQFDDVILDTYIELWKDGKLVGHVRVNENTNSMYFVTNHSIKDEHDLSMQQECNTVDDIVDFMTPSYHKIYTISKEFGDIGIVSGNGLLRKKFPYPENYTLQTFVEKQLKLKFISNYQVSENTFAVVTK
jgi:hypothetical protein